MPRAKSEVTVPSLEQVEKERKRIKRDKQYKKTLRETIGVLIVVAAIAVLVATLVLPILQVSGVSMYPTLKEDNIVLLYKTKKFERGDIIGFYYQGKILLKRVIALPGEEINFDADGYVYINGELLNEPYIAEPSLGECDIELPYKVPEQEYFVMGDSRSVSGDSRVAAIGTIPAEDIIGRIFLKVWPLNEAETF